MLICDVTWNSYIYIYANTLTLFYTNVHVSLYIYDKSQYVYIYTYVYIYYYIYPARACAARGKLIEFVCLCFCKKKIEMAWTSHFQDFWAYQKVWKRSYLTYLYLPLGWLAPTLWDFCCFLIVRSSAERAGYVLCRALVYRAVSINNT